ncbi:MAG: hypothetical protein A3J48_02380 [Candidatus Doudnabacteria bacterium RIFCSPHIGHO2_02_FULL_46_11]|uniref:DEAD/DEAH box helicase n=1 Tax=Candidatus Doudnabacteria bacterium RIFCSPHIGHO2_02_FULL_46_11 TaxID=1817832 RepID=A0A1F5P8P4_9BACT|nr:MAG: hypothetical protein A3J48_02380 [Candidatus Doudnabacteria bacterium RIFCSPHIGHO2_02_FULL_46_11]
MTTTEPEKNSFYNLGIAPKLLEILDRLNFKIPTPIQTKSIPIGLEGKDMMGIAQTGTGKTLAFGIPMIQRLALTKKRGLVILPTRELALQVEETIYKIGNSLGVKTAVLIGGAPMNKQISALKRNPHIVIGTPGRLNDHLQQKTLELSKVGVLILDEADRMLDMGFLGQIERIVKHVPQDRQTLLFSATMPEEIIKLASSYMKLPIRVEIERPGTAAADIKQELFFVKKENKINLLQKMLNEYKGSALVFSRTKHGASKISKALRGAGFSSTEIHSNRSLPQRRAALDGFKAGKFRVLVATDIAARGIDVKGIQLVLNFDIPENPGDYVHRIGRTGRAGMSGNAITFATPDQTADVRDIERLIRTTLPVSKHSEFSAPAELGNKPGRSREARPNREPRQYRKPQGGSFGGSKPRRGRFDRGRPPRADKKRTFIDFRSGGSFTKPSK